MQPRLQNKNILITGGTSGIGKASAFKLVSNGARVVISGRNESSGNEIIKKIENDGGKAKFIACDITDKKQIENLFNKTISHFGKIDGIFNNAGIEGEIAPFDESTEENWDNVFNTNLKSMWHCMKHAIEHMLQNEYGNIVNMASTSGIVGNGFGLSAYAASKHAIIGLTKSVALEYAKKNIRVNTICPGFIETEMIEKICAKSPSLKRRFTAAHPIGRMGTPGEIGDALVYLLSDESSFMTGNSFIIDGGLTVY